MDNFTIVAQTFCTDLASENWKTVKKTPKRNFLKTPLLPTPNRPCRSKPHPCNMPQAKTEVALQFLECCAGETALQHSLFCSADVICTKSCAAANEKLHCNIEIAALQESGAFLPLSCGFQAPTFRHPRFGLADNSFRKTFRTFFGTPGLEGGDSWKSRSDLQREGSAYDDAVRRYPASYHVCLRSSCQFGVSRWSPFIIST